MQVKVQRATFQATRKVSTTMLPTAKRHRGGQIGSRETRELALGSASPAPRSNVAAAERPVHRFRGAGVFLALILLVLLTSAGIHSNSRQPQASGATPTFAVVAAVTHDTSRSIVISVPRTKCNLPFCHQHPPSSATPLSEMPTLAQDGRQNAAASSVTSWRKPISLEVDPPVPRFLS